MDPITQQTVLAAAGAGGGPLYVDDVFSTYVYEGDAVGGADTQTINNGIDLAGEGGLVWIKDRSTNGREHILIDTERGATKYISSDQTSGESTGSNHLNLFNNNGFRVGSDSTVNANTDNFVSWTFRKAPGFFDIVTWTGDGDSTREISHNLECIPGLILCKRLDGSSSWKGFHIGSGITSSCLGVTLNTNEQFRFTGVNNSARFSSTMFQPYELYGMDLDRSNESGQTYVAYLFAHDDARFGTDEDESIIKCGTWTSSGGAASINLGFEPQFVMTKNASAAGAWFIFDNMRGMAVGGGDAYLRPDTSDDENSATNFIELTSTGFNVLNYGSSQDFIYMAIRRPNKPPTAATEVFAIDSYGGTAPSPPTYNSGFAVDMAMSKFDFDSNRAVEIGSRLTGAKFMETSAAQAEISDSSFKFDYQNGWKSNTGTSNTSYSYMFKRAPGFMDVVAYTGKSDTAGLNVTHNLGVVPELVFFKRRDYTKNWYGYSSVTGTGKVLYLDTDLAAVSDSSFIPTTPTSTELTVNSYSQIFNQDSTFIAYLFATLPGISKVGSYTGTGSAINVDCGFTNGARFILIKRTDGSGNVGGWYVWDSVRGIVSGNDPYLLLNTTAAQVTNTDYIDPLSTGFTVTSSAPAALNVSGGTYLFLAIA